VHLDLNSRRRTSSMSIAHASTATRFVQSASLTWFRMHCVPAPTGQTSVPPRPAVAISVYPLPNSVYGGRQRVVDACLSPLVQLWLYVYMSHRHSPATGVYVCLRASMRSLNCCDFFAQCRSTSSNVSLYVGPPSVHVGRLT
jgi:hypothetical protein